MCPDSWDGEHDWECFGDKTNPYFPDDDEARLLLWECAMCGARTTTQAWEGTPA